MLRVAGAQTKGHEENLDTGMQEKNRRRKVKTKNEKQEARHESKQAINRTQGVSIATNLPVSATKPRRGPCHTICDLLPALVGNGINCRCCRCRAPRPPRTNQRKPKQNCLDSGAVATQLPLISRTGTLPHDLPFNFFVDSSMSTQLGFHLLVEPLPCHTIYHLIRAKRVSN